MKLKQILLSILVLPAMAWAASDAQSSDAPETIQTTEAQAADGQAGQIQQSQYVYHPRTGKLIMLFNRSGRTQYHYDDGGRFIRVEGPDGRVVALEYGKNSKPRMISDTDPDTKSIRRIFIKYNAKSTPSELVIPGVGRATVTYEADGNIKDIKSPQGEAIAIQVAMTMYHLLSLVHIACPEVGK